jgi:hypothetical protein
VIKLKFLFLPILLIAFLFKPDISNAQQCINGGVTCCVLDAMAIVEGLLSQAVVGGVVVLQVVVEE